MVVVLLSLFLFMITSPMLTANRKSFPSKQKVNYGDFANKIMMQNLG